MSEDQWPEIAGQLAQWRTALFDWLMRLAEELPALPGMLAQLADPAQALAAVRLLALIALVLGLQRVLRARGDRLIDRLAAWQQTGGAGLGPLRGATVIVAAVGIHAIKLAIVAAVAYGAVLVGVVPGPGWATVASQFALAFVIAEIGRLALNAFLEPRTGCARVLPLDDDAAVHWETRLSGLIRAGAYGLVFAVPGIALQAPAVAGLAELIVVIIVLLGVLAAIRDARSMVRAWLLAVGRHRRGLFLRPLTRMLAPVWHVLAGLYSITMAILVVAAPPAVLAFTIEASATSVVVLLIAGFLGHWLTSLAHLGRYLPVAVRKRLPMLQARLNHWLPKLLAVVHLLLAVVALAVIADAWQLINLGAWLESSAGETVMEAVGALLGIGVLAMVVWLLGASWIEDRLNPDTGSGAPGAREKTLLALFRNALAIAIVTLAGMVALAEIGINIGPLIAGAGVIGLAIGFGAQKLVQDIITGVFIQLEDAIHADDFITAAGISGTVERLSIRSVGLRDLSGTLHIVPFSSVDTVSNYTRDFGYHLGVYEVAYRENIGDVVEHLQKAYERLCGDGDIAPEVTGPLEVDGVTALAESSVKVRVRIRSTAGMQWAVGRAYNRYVKEVFDNAGISIPFPHMTLYFGEDKAGNAPPAHVALTHESKPTKEG
ncbi:mechanosensitive ion channel domain-containing protein [Spiribacter onubensis]|uniref:Mechanosensitive ion channel domain-containing protein n=1 Tax=Spiribacter onubensis TaxID=3122420 RepID=A0ABV3S9X6_9GAMM